MAMLNRGSPCLFLIVALLGYVETQCSVGSCICDTSKGMINLNRLATKNDYSLSGVYDGYTYYYNPCKGIQYASCASGSALCQEKADKTAYFSVGAVLSEKIVIEGDDLTIKYEEGDGGRYSIVRLICDPSAKTPVFVPKGEPYTLEYDFELTTECACYDGCSGSAPDPNDGNNGGKGGVAAGEAGIVLMALALVAIIAYFVIGGIVLHVKFDKRGMEVVPQKSFWFALPLLVRDGFKFTFFSIAGIFRRRPDNNYQTI